jgi:hypothetical protein
MERKKISNFTILLVTIVICGVMVISKTVMVLKNRHEEKLMFSMHTKVEYYAKRCYLEGKCSGNIILNDLYEKEYLKEEVVNPITKEVLDKNIIIRYEDEEVVINW